MFLMSFLKIYENYKFLNYKEKINLSEQTQARLPKIDCMQKIQHAVLHIQAVHQTFGMSQSQYLLQIHWVVEVK